MSASAVQSLHPYDDFVIAMLQLEHIGFCDGGKGGDFVLNTDMSIKGDLPLNTGGGQIQPDSRGWPGAV